MEGHAKISTFEAMKMDPVTKPIYTQMVDASGSPIICQNVWISYFTGGRDKMGEGYGIERAYSDYQDGMGREIDSY